MDQIESTRLGTYLEMVPDPRKRRGQRYRWSFLLIVICAGLASGQKSVWAIAQWAQLHSTELCAALYTQYARIPSPSTLYRALRHVDIKALEQCIGAFGARLWQWAVAKEELTGEDGPWQGIAVDGKEICGAARHGPKVHLVSLVTHAQGLILGQQRVAEKGYEPETLRQLLEGQDLSRRVITMDALYTHADLAQQIRDQGGAYLMMVKRNQPQLHEAISLLFSEKPLPGEKRWRSRQWGKGHGRREVRCVTSSEALNAYLTWPGVAQVVQRTCSRTRGEQTEEDLHTTTSYAITSLSHAQASASDLADLWRSHWVIENRLHYVRDETLAEDRGQIAKGQAPQALASLRNAVLIALRSRGWHSIAQALRVHAARTFSSLQLILNPLG